MGDVVHCPALGRSKRQVAFDGKMVGRDVYNIVGK